MMRCVDERYPCSCAVQVLYVWTLDWCAQQRQIFHYYNGAWAMKGSLHIMPWDNLLALESLFIHLVWKVQEENVTTSWSWEEAKHNILDIVGDNVEANGDLIAVLVKIARDNSDHLRASTANKIEKRIGCAGVLT